MRDFTLKIYELLLRTFQNKGYTCITYAEYCSVYNCRKQEMEGENERVSERERERGSDFDRSLSDSENKEHRSPITDNRLPITKHLAHFVILRHDVDAKPLNSLRSAELEHSLGIRGTYYFRCGPNGFDRDVIQKIASLGHEIGYHYETVDQAVKQKYSVFGIRYSVGQVAGSRQSRAAIQKLNTLCYAVYSSVILCVTKKVSSPEKQVIHHAYRLFVTNLRKLRRIAPVSTICMHGSPLARFDNREIWKSYDYRKHDILGDPYFDTDFSKVAYFTDTGRRWDGASFSVRDKVYDSETKRRRDGETEGLRDEKSKRRRDEETKRGRDEETERQSEGARERGSDRLPITDYRLPHAQSPEPHAPCSMPYAPCSMPHAPCPKQSRSTNDIIRSLQEGTFPDQVMLTVHPQRWNDARMPWLKELLWQNVKNPVKRFLIKIKD